ncbi:MAG: HD domain-containing protein [Bacilli bacterium]|nr:HD domain-containing protein [Bacilli bacterium]MBO6284934.1 HD domain-containing protein [Bacilli bacterium]
MATKLRGIRNGLIRYVEETILPSYEGVDTAHGLEHILTVTKNALSITKHYNVDPELVYVIASYHDIGIRFGRDDHHLTSGKWLYDDSTLRNFFSEEEILLMKEAVEDHRASSKHPPRSIYGAIIAEADRDLSPNHVIERCAQFAIAHNPEADHERLVQICLSHLKEKYGDGGYLKLYLYAPSNVEGLKTIRALLREDKMEPKVQEALRKFGH